MSKWVDVEEAFSVQLSAKTVHVHVHVQVGARPTCLP